MYVGQNKCLLQFLIQANTPIEQVQHKSKEVFQTYEENF